MSRWRRSPASCDGASARAFGCARRRRRISRTPGKPDALKSYAGRGLLRPTDWRSSPFRAGLYSSDDASLSDPLARTSLAAPNSLPGRVPWLRWSIHGRDSDSPIDCTVDPIIELKVFAGQVDAYVGGKTMGGRSGSPSSAPTPPGSATTPASSTPPPATATTRPAECYRVALDLDPGNVKAALNLVKKAFHCRARRGRDPHPRCGRTGHRRPVDRCVPVSGGVDAPPYGVTVRQAENTRCAFKGEENVHGQR